MIAQVHMMPLSQLVWCVSLQLKCTWHQSQLVWFISRQLKCTWHHCHTDSWSVVYHGNSNVHDTIVTLTAGLLYIMATQMYMTPLSHWQLVCCISWQLKCTWHHCHTDSWSVVYHGNSNVHDTIVTLTAGLLYIMATQMYMTPLSHWQLVCCISWQLKCTWHHCHSWSVVYHGNSNVHDTVVTAGLMHITAAHVSWGSVHSPSDLGHSGHWQFVVVVLIKIKNAF